MYKTEPTSQMQGMNGVSVIICCYNSASRLPETLACLAHQHTAAGIPVEILLIDNASTDATAETANDVWKELNSSISFNILTEDRPGKNYAIETGIAAAAFDLVLFCDDDNLLQADYIQTGFDYFQQHASLALLGGRGVPRLPAGNIPEWFERYAYQYALGAQAAASGDITVPTGYVYGAGSFLWKAAFNQLKKQGFRYTLTGRKNGLILPGEDNELGYALSLTGYSIHYHAALVFTHVLPASRFTWRYIKRLKKDVAYSSTLLIPYKEYRQEYLSHIPSSFSWTACVLLHLRYLVTNVLQYAFASKSFKTDIRLDIQARLGSLEALFMHRSYLTTKTAWLPWLAPASKPTKK